MDKIIDQSNYTEMQPANYPEMDSWLNALPAQDWTAILGAYNHAALSGIIACLRARYGFNLQKWTDMAFSLYWNGRNINSFKGKTER